MHESLVIPPDPPVAELVDATTVLAGKGTLRPAKKRRALARLRAVVASGVSDGRLRRDHEAEADHVGLSAHVVQENGTE